MDDNKLKHSLAVAQKMVEIATKIGLTREEIEDCFVIGLNHDIGYEFIHDNLQHNVIGGKILKRNNYKYWKEIYYHGKIDTDYESKFLDVLNQADMQIDKFGNDVGYDNRLEDIKNRYGDSSDVYQKCVKLVKRIR